MIPALDIPDEKNYRGLVVPFLLSADCMKDNGIFFFEVHLDLQHGLKN